MWISNSYKFKLLGHLIMIHYLCCYQKLHRGPRDLVSYCMEVRTYLSVSSHGSISTSSDHQQVWLRYWTLSCYRLVSAGGQAVISYLPDGNVTWYDPSAHSFLYPPPPSHLRQSWPLFHIGFASCQSQFPAHFNFTEEKKPLDCVTNHPWIFNGLLRQFVN